MAKGDQTRKRIIAESMPIFNTRGYAGTSMSELLRATGLEKGGIYNHFPSKEALALAAFDYAVMQVAEHFEQALAGQEHAIDRLLAIASVFEQYIDAPPVPGGCPVMNTAVEADDAHPALRERAQHTMTTWHRLIGRIIKDGKARGEVRTDVDPYQVASIMTSLLEGALMQTQLYNDGVHLRRALAHLKQYFQALAPEQQGAQHG
jgi:TetR/AcrR family transcriptional repressor of nem operon